MNMVLAHILQECISLEAILTNPISLVFLGVVIGILLCFYAA